MFKNHLSTLLLFFCFSPILMAQVSPIEIGRSSNVFSTLRGAQNQVYANDSANTVAFIHRQDVTIWGGGNSANGQLRMALSTDGGQTFTTELGSLSPTQTLGTRYPQITAFTPAGGFEKFAWAAPTSNPSVGWDGIATGMATIANDATVQQEEYGFTGQNTLLPGGLCQSTPGTLWMTSGRFDGANTMPQIDIYRGAYNSGSDQISWTRHDSVVPNHHTALNAGTPTVIDPNLAFSPDGTVGWMAFLGDLVGGQEGSIVPVLTPSFDGGNSWGTPIEVDLRNLLYKSYGERSLQEDLQDLWVTVDGVSGDTLPAASGIPTCAFDYDLTVDQNGNPHFFVVIGNRPENGYYSISSGLAKYAVDIYSEDGGLSWKASRIAPVYTFRGNFGTPDPGNGSLISMDNQPQVARSQDGSRIFYSWVDSDTTVIGFGESNNLAPNLRIASRRISDGLQTCPRWITQNDIIWDGRALFPAMAPEVLYDELSQSYQLPIVLTEMINNDQLQPCSFWYFGNDATVAESEYISPANFLNTANCTQGMVAIEKTQIPSLSFEVFPNPNRGQFQLQVPDMPHGGYDLTIFNTTGQVLYQQKVNQLLTDIDLSFAPRGIYMLNLQSASSKGSFRLILE